MKNKIWEKNLKAIERKLPGWRAYIEEKKYELAKKDGPVPYFEGVEAQTEEAYNGEKISRISYEGRSGYLSGKYQPTMYAGHLAQKVEDQGYGAVVLVLGLSDGRFLKEFAARKSSDTLVIVYEPSVELFEHVLREYDISGLFSDRKVGILVNGINEKDFAGTLQQTVSIDNLVKLRVLVMGNYEKLFPEWVKKILDDIREYTSQMTIQWNTMVNFTGSSIYNIIKNFRVMYDHYNFNDLHGILPKNVPAVIVGAGPSLDKNIDQLKQAKGKACIIACDTALKPLIDHGIIPDLFAVVDPKKPMELFDREQIRKIPVIAGLNVPYEMLERQEGKIILYHDSMITAKVMLEVFGPQWLTPQHYMGGIPTGGNVAGTAFSAARLMGARKIILVGQDMALSAEKEHAEGTFQTDRRFDLSSKSLPRVEGIDGQEVPTLYILKRYLEWFEEQIRMYPKLKVINATEGGAKIHGSKQMTLQQAIDTYMKCKREFQMEKYLKKIKPHFGKEEKEKAGQWFMEMPKRMRAMERRVVNGGNYYVRLEEMALGQNYTTAELKKLLKKIKKLNNWLDKDEEAALIMEGLKTVEYTLRTQMYTFADDGNRNLMESARIGYQFMYSMQVVLREMAPVFEEVAAYFREKTEHAK